MAVHFPAKLRIDRFNSFEKYIPQASICETMGMTASNRQSFFALTSTPSVPVNGSLRYSAVRLAA